VIQALRDRDEFDRACYEQARCHCDGVLRIIEESGPLDPSEE
jgi:hypothetical protein